MDYDTFHDLVASVGLEPVPERFRSLVSNVALLVEDAVSDETRMLEGLEAADQTLLGLYVGIPHTERGEVYGFVLPDTITLYRLPILEEARITGLSVKKVVEDTIWHEIAHHLGLDEEKVHKREEERGFFH